jgi:hypothetical protein
MLRNLLSEIRHRHLWPIPVVALLVAVAAPLLFLKSASEPASPASADAVTAPAGQLPARARRLLDADNVAQTAARRPARNASDPFQAPSHGAAASADTSAADAAAAAGTDTAGATPGTSAPAAATDPQAPVAVVITNSDGDPETPDPETPADPAAPDKASAAPAAVARAVTIRFGQQFPAPVKHSIARTQTFVSDGSVVAIFVKYSPARDKAVFAIAPSAVVTGNVACRRVAGVCRYVDLAVGKHVRLATRAADGTLVSSRLDVVRIDQTPTPDASSAAGDAPANGSCLLAKLLTLTTEDQPLSRDAC